MLKDEEKELFLLLGERLKDLRKKSGYSSQEIFAYDAEIPRALYGKYEKGCNITLSSLRRILKFHKIRFEDFFSEGFKDM